VVSRDARLPPRRGAAAVPVAVIIVREHDPHMSAAKRRLLAIAGSVALAVPFVGLPALSTAVAADSDGARAIPTPQQNEQRRYDQARPRTAVPFDPSRFDAYVGWYELSPTVLLHVTRNGSHYFSQLTGQTQIEIYPDSPTEFFLMVAPVQISFEVDAQGRATGLVLHQGGLLHPAKKVDRETAMTAEAALRARIRANEPSPGTEAAIRRWIAAKEHGQTDEAEMAPNLAGMDRVQQPLIQRTLGRMGPFKSLEFERVNAQGMDVYRASFAHGQLDVLIAPLTPDGKITGLLMRPHA
jgi:hypothetical protein